MTLWIAAAVLVAAALAVALATLLRRRAAGVLAENAVVTAAEQAVPGFAALESLIGDDRRAALVVGRHARVALVFARGRKVSAREVRWQDVRALPGGLSVGPGTPVFVAGVDVLDVRRAGGAEMRVPERQASRTGHPAVR